MQSKRSVRGPLFRIPNRVRCEWGLRFLARKNVRCFSVVSSRQGISDQERCGLFDSIHVIVGHSEGNKVLCQTVRGRFGSHARHAVTHSLHRAECRFRAARTIPIRLTTRLPLLEGSRGISVAAIAPRKKLETRGNGHARQVRNRIANELIRRSVDQEHRNGPRGVALTASNREGTRHRCRRRKDVRHLACKEKGHHAPVRETRSVDATTVDANARCNVREQFPNKNGFVPPWPAAKRRATCSGVPGFVGTPRVYADRCILGHRRVDVRQSSRLFWTRTEPMPHHRERRFLPRYDSRWHDERVSVLDSVRAGNREFVVAR